MSNVLTLLRRELGHQFRSPLAYVFLVLFVVFVQLPYMLTIFLERAADLRGFFNFLPWLVVVFAALVTMRSWAEERQENTYEMLLTFPMRDWELVVAKFLSAFAFLSVGLLCTASLPIMIFMLGDPDPGPILTGYLGAFLIAGMWCAAGVFFSGLTRSQLLAALISFVFGMVSLFLGVDQVAMLIEGKAAGLGGLLESVIGTWGHYSSLSRGVIEFADVLFFLLWIAVFLYLNTIHISMRRAASRAALVTACTVLAVGCGLLGSRLLDDLSLSRTDLTAEGLYTLSDGTVSILKRADVPVRATLYISPRDDMPSHMQDLEQQVVDQLQEMKLRSGGMLDYRVVHMEAANLAASSEPEFDLGDGEEAEEEEPDTVALDEDESIEERLIDRGVRPFPVQQFDATEMTQKWVYSTIGLAYREKDEELLTPIVPQVLPELEYRVASTVSLITRTQPPRIALFAGREKLDPQAEQYMRARGQQLPDVYRDVVTALEREKFEVVRTALTQHDPMPDDYDAFLCIEPVEFDDRQRWELNRALISGKPVLLAVQNYLWDFPVDRGRITINRRGIVHGVEEVLAAQGISVSTHILMQQQDMFPLMVPVDVGGFRMSQQVPAPMNISVLSENMNKESAVTDRLSKLYYLWGTSIEVDEGVLANRLLEHETLISTGEAAWLVPVDRQLARDDLTPEGKALASYPVLVQVEGQFVDAFEGQERPKWAPSMQMAPDGRPLPPPPDVPTGPITKSPGRLYVAGSSRMWQSGILNSPGNHQLLMSLVSAMTLDPALLDVRTKQATAREFQKPTDRAALMWTLLPLLFVPLALIALGLGVGVRRIRGRENWDVSHGR